MADWRDNLQAASFRGVEFLTDGAEVERGRRLVVHQYPRREEWDVEDLGRSARRYPLEIYILASRMADGFWSQRDRIAEALEAEGPGTLVHPYYGSLQVHVEDARESYSTRDGGVVRWSVKFVLGQSPREPKVRADTPVAVRTRATAALGGARESFSRVFSVEDRPEFVAGAARSVMEQLTAELRSLAGGGSMARPYTAYVDQIGRASAEVAALVRRPTDLAVTVTDLLGGLSAVFRRPAQAVQAYRSLFRFGSGLAPVPAGTVTRAQQARNQHALTALVRQAAVIEAAQSSSAMSFPTLDEATQVRDELAGELDRHMLTADDALYPLLGDLRVAVIRDITARGADLARIVRYTPTATMPALVLAHRLYGDAAQADHVIVARNRSVRHPGFVRGGQALEIQVRD